MLRLPHFQLHTPTDLAEAAHILADSGPAAMLLAGGTDLLPNMKRGQQKPAILVALRRIESLHEVRTGSVEVPALQLGAGVKLAAIVNDHLVGENYTALRQAAGLVASPQLRNMATLGGNICLDTRCTFYDQSEHWRKSINHCLKTGGDICWVVTKSKQCRAVSATDTAPALVALGARVHLVSACGERSVALNDFYHDDGMDYTDLRPGEILTGVMLEPANDWKSTYWKLRRRGSIDFPILSLAAAARVDKGGTVRQARMVLGALSSRPLLSAEASEFLVGKKLSDEVIEETGRILAGCVKPVNNTDLTPLWRKKVIPVYARYALCELRGDDMRAYRHGCLT